MPSTQNRAPLGESLAFHSHRPASSLTARQYTSTLTSSAAFPDGKDSAIVNATDGAVNITLPAGSDSIIGLPFHAERANADATSNAVALVCAGTDTFVDGSTSISSTATTDLGLHLAAVWDGAKWRPYFPGAANGGGVGAFSTLSASSSMTVGDGSGSPVLDLQKSDGGTSVVKFTSNAKKRWTIGLDASENLTISRFNTSEVLQESAQFLAASGVFVAPTGLTVTAGGLTVTAGDVTVSADNLAVTLGDVTVAAGDIIATLGDVTAGGTLGGAALSVNTATVFGLSTLAGGILARLPTHADNAAAALAGLAVDRLYKTATGEVRIVVP